MTNLAVRERANDELGKWILKRRDELISKGYTQDQATSKLGNKIDQWTEENSSITCLKEFGKKMGSNPGGGLGSVTSKATGDGTPVSEHFDQHGRRITTLGRDVNPFRIDERTLDLMSKSVKSGHAFQVKLVEDGVTTKGFNTVESLLPAELMPGVVERIHEPRIADLLPTVSSSTLNYEFISDNTTSNTVTGITGEGVAAPDAVLSFGETTLAAQAIKCTFGASYETLSDRPSLLGYLTAEVFK